MKKPHLFVLATMLLALWGITTTHADSPSDVAPATYEVTFDSTWSTATHPTDYPGSAHYSRLVGTTHNNSINLWREGDLATEGIRIVAEFGGNSTLEGEVNAHIASGNAYSWIYGSSLWPGVGQIIHQFDTDTNNPYVSLVSMIAPSPDWIVGVDSLNLQDASGNWIPTITVPAYPYDAGTDSGTTYESANAPTNPREPISNITGVAPLSNQPFGTFTFELQTTPLAVSLQSQSTTSASPLAVILMTLTVLAICSLTLTQKKATVTITPR